MPDQAQVGLVLFFAIWLYAQESNSPPSGLFRFMPSSFARLAVGPDHNHYAMIYFFMVMYWIIPSNSITGDHLFVATSLTWATRRWRLSPRR
jgi:hypothetical protein